MKNEFQDLESLIPSIQKAFEKNPRRSLSAFFRNSRKSPRYSLIGDYPILATITHTAIKMGIEFSRNKVLHALNQSDELKTLLKGDKKDLTDQLFLPLTVASKQGKNAFNFNGNEKDDTLLVKTIFQQ